MYFLETARVIKGQRINFIFASTNKKRHIIKLRKFTIKFKAHKKLWLIGLVGTIILGNRSVSAGTSIATNAQVLADILEYTPQDYLTFDSGKDYLVPKESYNAVSVNLAMPSLKNFATVKKVNIFVLRNMGDRIKL